MGAIHVHNSSSQWKSGVPWASTGSAWRRGKAAWRYNGTQWVRFWQLPVDPPRAPEVSVERRGDTGVRVTVRLRGPYPSKIIRTVVKLGINKRPTANNPLASDGTYYSSAASNDSNKSWSEWWKTRSPNIMGSSTTLEGSKNFPFAGVKAIPYNSTVYVSAWIQDEHQRWSPVGTASVKIPAKPPAPAPKPKPPAKKTYDQTFSMSWFRSYDGANNPYSWANNAGRAMQGQYLAANGRTRSLIGFPDVRSQIGEIKSIQYYVYMDHWYYSNGGTLLVGTHGHHSAPAKWSAGNVGLMSASYTKRDQGRWISLPASQFAKWKNGGIRGISLAANSSSSSYYGYATASSTRMRIVHIK